MHIHNASFYGEMEKTIPELSSNTPPVTGLFKYMGCVYEGPDYSCNLMRKFADLGPVIQSIVSLTSSSVVKMITGIFAEKM